jgi:sensor histidine kinase YesM
MFNWQNLKQVSSEFFSAKVLYLFLPLIAVLLVESHINFLMLKATQATSFLDLLTRLTVQWSPFLVCHYLSYSHGSRNKYVRTLWWLLGFIVYPAINLFFVNNNTSYQAWNLLALQGWILALVASLYSVIYPKISWQSGQHKQQLFSRLFSLNTVVSVLLLAWAFLMAGVFNSTVEPMINQPLNLVIDIGKVFTEFSQFVYYLWQFLVMAALMFALYALNRFCLIQHVLANKGLIHFVLSCIIVIIAITPLMGHIILLLPVNIPSLSLIPSGNFDVYDPINHQFLFAFLFVSTPVILAFEKQKHESDLNQIAQQQTQTELKLLQQQINPHFLFNTLNNLYALALTKSDDSPALIMQLSNLLRYTVYEGQKDKVLLSQEVSYLQDYIALQSIRYHKKCQLDVQWPQNAEQYTIPPLLLIILLENLFKYGVEPATEQVQVRFHLNMQNNQLNLYSENPIFANNLSSASQLVCAHKNQSNASGLGLLNLQRRLNLQFPRQHTLNSTTENGLWQTTLSLNLQRAV